MFFFFSFSKNNACRGYRRYLYYLLYSSHQSIDRWDPGQFTEVALLYISEVIGLELHLFLKTYTSSFVNLPLTNLRCWTWAVAWSPLAPFLILLLLSHVFLNIQTDHRHFTIQKQKQKHGTISNE